MTRGLSALLVLLLALVGCGGNPPETPQETAKSAAPAGPAQDGKAVPALQRYQLGGDFTLTDQNGQPFHLSQLQGKTVLLFFGYTLCPDACPTTLSKLARVYSMLGPEAKDDVVTVFVSVDSGRDNPQKMKEYLEYFDINAIGLSGTKAQIDPIVAQYGARYEFTDSGSAAGYLVNHSTDLYLIDAKGDVRYVFKHKDPPDVLVPVIREALSQEA
ncbi:MAG TPA: SCO family protein [Thermoanaerobaculia bacterium]|nr:SCO family protein [Thermoanaerobaculia bacterium]